MRDSCRGTVLAVPIHVHVYLRRSFLAKRRIYAIAAQLDRSFGAKCALALTTASMLKAQRVFRLRCPPVRNDIA